MYPMDDVETLKRQKVRANTGGPKPVTLYKKWRRREDGYLVLSACIYYRPKFLAFSVLEPMLSLGGLTKS